MAAVAPVNSHRLKTVSLQPCGPGQLSASPPPAGHLHTGLQLSYDQRPPAIVRSIGVSTSVDGSALNGSRPSTTRSAHLPISIEPFVASSNDAYAPCNVPN